MARLIDADTMLEYLNLMYDKQNDSDEPFNCAVLGAINYIKHKAPTIEMPKWIPCSERLPSEDGWYLIALAFEWGIEYEAGRWEDGMWWNPNSHVNVAWMPLPQPYEETDHE